MPWFLRPRPRPQEYGKASLKANLQDTLEMNPAIVQKNPELLTVFLLLNELPADKDLKFEMQERLR